MKHMDPLSTENPLKNSFEFLNTLKNASKLLPTGAVDANRDENLEPLTPIRIKFWSH